MAHEQYRKLYHYGKARAMTIPEPWIRYQQKKAGKKLERVRVISREDRIEVYPLFEEGEPEFPKEVTKASKFLEISEDEEDRGEPN